MKDQLESMLLSDDKNDYDLAVEILKKIRRKKRNVILNWAKKQWKRNDIHVILEYGANQYGWWVSRYCYDDSRVFFKK